MPDNAHLKKSNEGKEAAAAAGFVLTAGDVELFKLLHAYRFLRREHFSALTGRPAKRLHRGYRSFNTTVSHARTERIIS